jgi:hypothetical protein
VSETEKRRQRDRETFLTFSFLNKTKMSGQEDTGFLDGKKDLLTGKQGWKCPGVLLVTCCGCVYIMRVFLVTVTVMEGFFSKSKTSFPTKIRRPNRVPKMGDGRVFHTPCVVL